MSHPLDGKKGLILGIANEHSIAWGCAKAFHAAGAQLAITWLNDKARPHVQPLADQVQAPIQLPLDVEDDQQFDALFQAINKQWGKLDFVLHSIAYAPALDLQGRIIDCTRPGFERAMSVSCHSFLKVARLAEPLMQEGGCLLTMSYLGAHKVIDNYGLMGPVKAALESSVRYLAAELGPKGIRVNAVSPGPMMTRAASGIAHFNELLDDAKRRAPMRRLADIDDTGALCSFLVSDGARSITGNTIYVDAGYHIIG